MCVNCARQGKVRIDAVTEAGSFSISIKSWLHHCTNVSIQQTERESNCRGKSAVESEKRGVICITVRVREGNWRRQSSPEEREWAEVIILEAKVCFSGLIMMMMIIDCDHCLSLAITADYLFRLLIDCDDCDWPPVNKCSRVDRMCGQWHTNWAKWKKESVSESEWTTTQLSSRFCQYLLKCYDANFPFPSLPYAHLSSRLLEIESADRCRRFSRRKNKNEEEEEEGKVFQNRTHTLVSGVWLIKEVYTLSEWADWSRLIEQLPLANSCRLLLNTQSAASRLSPQCLSSLSKWPIEWWCSG